ncbi:MAG TPA: YraN family protein [Candidatus Hydrogenedentes bacterium]|nr:YraN family protein [Candidatus Hydrogenedentota bacterium]HPG68410.1 YraN family protein [Candidatus Hydrogenedentota bacterium]
MLFRRRPRDLWHRGEDAVARYLRARGYRILGRNVKLSRYEVDIIARKRDITAFVEVKTRRENPLAPPEENVTTTKQNHLRRAAHVYIQREDNPTMYYRFDVAAVTVPEHGKPDITYFENAFPDQ